MTDAIEESQKNNRKNSQESLIPMVGMASAVGGAVPDVEQCMEGARARIMGKFDPIEPDVCVAPKITFGGVKTCRESKPEEIWCRVCRDGEAQETGGPPIAPVKRKTVLVGGKNAAMMTREELFDTLVEMMDELDKMRNKGVMTNRGPKGESR